MYRNFIERAIYNYERNIVLVGEHRDKFSFWKERLIEASITLNSLEEAMKTRNDCKEVNGFIMSNSFNSLKQLCLTALEIELNAPESRIVKRYVDECSYSIDDFDRDDLKEFFGVGVCILCVTDVLGSLTTEGINWNAAEYIDSILLPYYDEQGVRYLISEIGSKFKIPFLYAYVNPQEEVKRLIKEYVLYE